MTTPTRDETKHNAPAKTPGFVKGLFGLFSSTKPKHDEVINDGNNVTNGQPTNIGVQNPRTLFVNNGPDLISGTPMISRHREIVPHPQQTLSLRNGSGMMLNNPTSSMKRKAPNTSTTTMDSPWVPRRVNEAHSQQFSSSETSVGFQMGVKRREGEARTGTNSIRTNGERNVPYVRAHALSTTTTSATAAGYRYKPKTNRYRQGSTQTPSQQIANNMREAMNRFQPNQVLLTHSTINRATEYKQFTSSGRLFTRRTRFPTIPLNSAVVMTGIKHRIEDEEDATAGSNTTPLTKRQRVTFGDDSKSSAFGSPASVHSTSAKGVNEIDEFVPRPSLSFELLYENVPLASATITKPHDGLPPINANLQPLVVPPKLASITRMQLLLKEGTKSIKQKKSKVVDNTVQDQLPSVKKQRSDATNVVKATSGWGDTFANQKKLWKCSACYTQNKQEFTKCQSCEAPRVLDTVNTFDLAATKGNNSVASPGTSSNISNPVSSSIGSGGFVFKPVHNNPTIDKSASFTPSIGSVVNKGSVLVDSETVGHLSPSQIGTKGGIGNNGFTFGVSQPGNGIVTSNEKSNATGAFSFGGMSSFSSTTNNVSQGAGTNSFLSATNNVSQDAKSEKSLPDQAAKPAGFVFGQPSALQTKSSKPASTPSELVEDNPIASNVSSLAPFSFGSKSEPESSVASKPTFGGFSFASGQESSKLPISETTQSNLPGPVTISMSHQKQDQINFGFSSGNVDANSTVSTKALDEVATKSVISNFQFGAGPVSTFDKPPTASQNSFMFPSLEGKEAVPAPASASPFQFGSALQSREGNVSAQTEIKSFGFNATPSVPQATGTTSTSTPAPFSGFGTGTSLGSAPSSSATPFVFAASTAAPPLPQQSVPIGTSELIRTNQFNSKNDSAFLTSSTESFGRNSMLAPAAMSTTSFGSVPVSAPTLPPLFGNTSSTSFGQPLTPAHSFAPPLATAFGDFGAQAQPQAPNFGTVSSNSAGFGSQPTSTTFTSATQPTSGFFGLQSVQQPATVLQQGFAPAQPSVVPAGSFQMGVGGNTKPTHRRILKAKRPSAR